MNENHLFWSRKAAKKREECIANDTAVRQCFMATEQYIRETRYTAGRHRVEVVFTRYILEIDADTNGMLRITSIEIMDVTER